MAILFSNHPINRLRSGQAHRAGRSRLRQDEACLTSSFVRDGVYVLIGAVVQGIDDSEDGRAACQLTIEVIDRAIHDKELQGAPLDELLSKTIRLANHKVYSAASQRGRFGSYGASVVMAAIAEYNNQDITLYLAHAGSARAYLLRGNDVWQLTLDHSWLQDKFDNSSRDPASYLNDPKVNDLWSFIGERANLNPTISLLEPNQNRMGQSLRPIKSRRRETNSLSLQLSDTILLLTTRPADDPPVHPLLHAGEIASDSWRGPRGAAKEMVKWLAKDDTSKNDASKNDPLKGDRTSSVTAVSLTWVRSPVRRWVKAVFTLLCIALLPIALFLLAKTLQTWGASQPADSIPPSIKPIQTLSAQVVSTVEAYLTPAATASATATATPSATATTPPMPTKTSVAASTPKGTSLPRNGVAVARSGGTDVASTPIKTATNTQIPTSTPTTAPTSTRKATSTQTETPTPRPTSTRTRTPVAPTSTRIPIVSPATLLTEASVTSEATATVLVASPTPLPTDTVVTIPSLRVQLVAPNGGDTVNGRAIFEWQIVGGILPKERAFEPVFAELKEDLLTNGQGWGGTTTQFSKGIDLTAFLPNGVYQWGVRLVDATTSQPIELISNLQTIRVEILSATSTPCPPDQHGSDGNC